MRFITRIMLRAVAGIGVTLALGLLAACGSSSSSDSGENGTPVTGTFIDAPVQGLSYKTGGWVARETDRKWQAIASSADGTKLVAANNRGIFTSTDSGATWTSRATSDSYDWQSVTSSADGTKLAGVNLNGLIYTSNDSGVTWTERQNTRNWVAITSSADGTKLAAVTSGGISSGQVYRSSDSGTTWTKAVLSDKPWRSIASSADGTKLAAAAAGHGTPGKIYTSTDSGVSWIARESDRNWRSIASSSDGTKLVAVVGAGRIYTSTDSGVSWTERESDRNWWSVTSSSDGTKLAAVTYDGQIYTSSDSGVSWTAVQSSRKWAAIASSADGSKLAAVVFLGSIHTYTTPVTKSTTAAGKYDCTTGEDVTFSLGNQVLGAVKCGEAVHVYHMAGSGNSVEKGVRVARLLQSLNTSTDTSKITLPDLTGITVNVRLDTNDNDFQTDVAALMAQLSGKGLVNTTPVTRDAAVAHVQTELAKLGDDLKTKLCNVNACNSELLDKLVKQAAVKVAVSGLPTGQAIDLQLAITGSNTKSTLKLEGAAGTLNAGFASVPLSGQTYTVSRTDSNAGIGCTLSNQTGSYNPLNAPTVNLSCSVNTKATTTLKGTVTGLASGQSVSLKNNEGTESLVISSNGSFQWGTAIAAGATYKLAVASQSPSNLTCTVTDGAGTAPMDVYSPNTSVVSNIAVACQLSGYSVGGTVTGLSSSDSLGLKLTSSDANANAKTVQVTGAIGGATYTFANTTIASGSTFSVALDGDAPTGYTCMVSSPYNSSSLITGNVSNANVVCTPTPSGGGSAGGGDSPSITSVTPGTALVGSSAMFAITGSNLPTTAILVLDGVECTSSMSASTGFAAKCPAPSSAGSSSAQVKTNTAANLGTEIGSSYTITVTASGGGSPTPPGVGTGGVVPTLPGSGGGGSGGAAGSCGTLNTTAGKVGGSVTGLSNNIGSVQLVMHDETNGVDIETLTVAYGVGCTTHYFTFQNTLTGTAWTARSTTQACNITANSSGVTPSGQNYINNVTVTCSGN